MTVSPRGHGWQNQALTDEPKQQEEVMPTYTQFPMERVYFGDEAAQALDVESSRQGAERVFVMGSASLSASTNYREEITRALGGRLAGWETGMPPHTPRDAVLAMTEKARKIDADLVVTFGGGSLTDAGKMVRLALQHGITDIDGFEPYRSIVNADGSSHRPDIEPLSVPQVAIPTTLSGGEFNVSAGCTHIQAKAKQLYRHMSFVPAAVILDPASTKHTPGWLWLSTGMRAIDHCVETICSQHGHRQSDGAALNGLRLLVQGLAAAHANPQDLEARLNCQIGTWQSMEHNQSSVPMGASHGIGHVLGGTCGIPHGHTSCVMLPATLRWNVSVNADRQALVSEAFGRLGDAAADAVEDFVRSPRPAHPLERGWRVRRPIRRSGSPCHARPLHSRESARYYFA